MTLRSETEAFENIRAKLQAIDTSNKDLAHIFKIRITQGGEVVKIMMLDLIKIKFYEGNDDAECTMTIPDDLLADVVLNKAETTGLITSGKVTVEGDVELAKLLGATLSQ